MRRLTLAASIALAVTTLAPGIASARKVEDVFAGKIVISSRGFPPRIRDTESFIDFIHKNASDVLWEDKDKDGKEKGSWQLRYMSFFRSPLADPTLEVKFYDITDGASRLVSSFDLDSLDRGQRILASTVTVSKDDGFEPNKRYRMTIESTGRILAETVITLRGDREHFSGQVSFSDADAASTQP